jgi:hypothetical protein
MDTDNKQVHGPECHVLRQAHEFGFHECMRMKYELTDGCWKKRRQGICRVRQHLMLFVKRNRIASSHCWLHRTSNVKWVERGNCGAMNDSCTNNILNPLVSLVAPTWLTVCMFASVPGPGFHVADRPGHSHDRRPARDERCWAQEPSYYTFHCQQIDAENIWQSTPSGGGYRVNRTPWRHWELIWATAGQKSHTQYADSTFYQRRLTTRTWHTYGTSLVHRHVFALSYTSFGKFQLTLLPTWFAYCLHYCTEETRRCMRSKVSDKCL